MPQDEDWMPINGNPHPVPGVPFPELPPFFLPPYPALGWNDVPPPPLEPAVNDVEDNNWGAWNEPVDQPVPQDQESMVIDDSAQPSSNVVQQNHVIPVVSSDEELPEADNVLLDDDINDVRNWAIVVYQPPLIVPEVELPAAVPFGPPLPPEMVWRRSFENLLQAPVVYNVPKPVALQPIEPVVLSKRSWDLAFRDMDLPMLT